jgi:hypothetical protein
MVTRPARTRRPAGFVFALGLFFLLFGSLGCGGAGAPAGGRCTRASECASKLCLFEQGGGACAQRCTASSECPDDTVCGRFDFRGVDPDSGMHAGDDREIVRVCRPPLNLSCGAGTACPADRPLCLADPGVCTTPCENDGACPSGRCIPSSEACGAPSVCAPMCDDGRECPRGFYCDLTATEARGHGRCAVIRGEDEPPAACDAGTE